MTVSAELFDKIVAAAEERVLAEGDNSISHAIFIIIEVVDEFQMEHPNIDNTLWKAVVQRIFEEPD